MLNFAKMNWSLVIGFVLGWALSFIQRLVEQAHMRRLAYQHREAIRRDLGGIE